MQIFYWNRRNEDFFFQNSVRVREQVMSLVERVLAVTKPDEVLRYLGTKQECNENDVSLKAYVSKKILRKRNDKLWRCEFVIVL